MKPAYLIAFGPNNCQIISMIFPSFDDGLCWLEDNSPFEWEVTETDFLMERTAKHIYNESLWIDEDKPEMKEFLDKIFTSWYFGCGGADHVNLVELADYNTPLCGFDLD
jgi:hypothetical protein